MAAIWGVYSVYSTFRRTKNMCFTRKNRPLPFTVRCRETINNSGDLKHHQQQQYSAGLLKKKLG